MAGDPEGKSKFQGDGQAKTTNAAGQGKPPKPAVGSGQILARVLLLHGEDYEVVIPKKAKGQELFDRVCKHLSLEEKDYFSISFRDPDDVKWWLQHDKKISKQVKSNVWAFAFEVKFYEPEPSKLQEDITRYALCLQIRNDIINGKLPLSFMSLALLGSYTAQSELGDYEPSDHNVACTKYLEDFFFAPRNQQTTELLEKISELHRTHKGQTPAEAESNFLENVKKMALYGVDLHEARDSENVPITLGVCAAGILVYRDRLRVNRFTWPKIIKFSYKRNNFYVKLRAGESDLMETTIAFKLRNANMARRLWRIAVDTHQFFRLREPETVKTGTLFPGFGSKFYRASGRTRDQIMKGAITRPPPPIDRVASSKRPVSTSDMDGMNKYGDQYDQQHTNHGGAPTESATLPAVGRGGFGYGVDQNELKRLHEAREQRLSQQEQPDQHEERFAPTAAGVSYAPGRAPAPPTASKEEFEDAPTSDHDEEVFEEASEHLAAHEPTVDKAVKSADHKEKQNDLKDQFDHRDDYEPGVNDGVFYKGPDGNTYCRRPDGTVYKVGPGGAPLVNGYPEAISNERSETVLTSDSVVGEHHTVEVTAKRIDQTHTSHHPQDSISNERIEAVIKSQSPIRVRAGGPGDPSVVRSTTHTYERGPGQPGGVSGGAGDAHPGDSLVSSSSHTSQSQTVETTTMEQSDDYLEPRRTPIRVQVMHYNPKSKNYTTEKDGITETTTTRKVLITANGEDDLDHEKLLIEAIKQVTEMDPDLTVEKIEIKTESEEVTDV